MCVGQHDVKADRPHMNNREVESKWTAGLHDSSPLPGHRYCLIVMLESFKLTITTKA